MNPKNWPLHAPHKHPTKGVEGRTLRCRHGVGLPRTPLGGLRLATCWSTEAVLLLVPGGRQKKHGRFWVHATFGAANMTMATWFTSTWISCCFSVCLSTYPPAYLSAHLNIHLLPACRPNLPTCLPIYLSIYPSISVCTCVRKHTKHTWACTYFEIRSYMKVGLRYCYQNARNSSADP